MPGTASFGGQFDFGFAYKLSPSGTFKIIHHFGNTGDGRLPRAQLVQGSNGFLYGTTALGGASNVGTVFRMNLKGRTTILHSFAGGSGGYGPQAELTEAADGYFWGITLGGAIDSLLIFKVNNKGKFRPVHSFPPDGAGSPSGLLLASDGSFYGTVNNSNSEPYGWLFKTLASGKTTTVSAFGGFEGDGRYPNGALAQMQDGLLYGVTDLGGEFDTNGVGGTVYSLPLP